MSEKPIRLVWIPHGGASDDDVSDVVARLRAHGAAADVDAGVGAFDVEQVILVAGSATQLATAIVALIEKFGLRIDLRKRRPRIEETPEMPPRRISIKRPDGTEVTLENPTEVEVARLLPAVRPESQPP
jgi:hypothetical protein